jgi:hypothetical protein
VRDFCSAFPPSSLLAQREKKKQWPHSAPNKIRRSSLVPLFYLPFAFAALSNKLKQKPTKSEKGIRTNYKPLVDLGQKPAAPTDEEHEFLIGRFLCSSS